MQRHSEPSANGSKLERVGQLESQPILQLATDHDHIVVDRDRDFLGVVKDLRVPSS
jgi:hypothetical protein